MTTQPRGADLHAADVGKRFANGLVAIEAISQAIEPGRFVSFVGPSGCGKSTFLRLVAGLTEPTDGSLTVDGLSAAEARAREAGLAFVLQDPTLLAWRRVAANVALPLELRGHDRSATSDRVSTALARVGLGAEAELYPHQLSGGMRMRVSIARALATDPALLLMDEPFGALDEITRQRLNEDLLDMWTQRSFTCLFVTHSVQEAAFLSQRVVVLSARPARVVATHEVPFPEPRRAALRTDPAFGRLVAQISADLATTMVLA